MCCSPSGIAAAVAADLLTIGSSRFPFVCHFDALCHSSAAKLSISSPAHESCVVTTMWCLLAGITSGHSATALVASGVFPEEIYISRGNAHSRLCAKSSLFSLQAPATLRPISCRLLINCFTFIIFSINFANICILERCLRLIHVASCLSRGCANCEMRQFLRDQSPQLYPRRFVILLLDKLSDNKM